MWFIQSMNDIWSYEKKGKHGSKQRIEECVTSKWSQISNRIFSTINDNDLCTVISNKKKIVYGI
jgi:hypothetical protein